MATTTNKNYILQSPGDTNWGTILNNQMISYVDLNIGGQKEVTVTATTNITGDDARNVIYRLIGSLGVNSTVILNESFAKGFFIVENKTIGAYTVAIKYLSNATTVIVPKDALALLICDSTNGVRLVSQSPVVTSFSAGTIGLTPSTATNGAVTLDGTLNVANGGTGLTTLTANNVILGNGTSTPSFVAPGTNGNLLTSNGTTWTSSALPPQATAPILMTAKTWNWNGLTTNTFLNFTNIPSWVKRVTLIFNGVSFAATATLRARLGSSGVVLETGYSGVSGYFGAGTDSQTLDGTGFHNNTAINNSGNIYDGSFVFNNLTSNTWACTAISSARRAGSSPVTLNITGSVTLIGVLDIVQLTSISNASFDAGTVNVLYD